MAAQLIQATLGVANTVKNINIIIKMEIHNKNKATDNCPGTISGVHKNVQY